MTKEEIAHLGTLARIELGETEKAVLASEISAILEYVSAVKAMAGDGVKMTPDLGVRYNVFRADTVTTPDDAYTETLLAEAPKRQGRFLSVKKILNQPSES